MDVCLFVCGDDLRPSQDFLAMLKLVPVLNKY